MTCNLSGIECRKQKENDYNCLCYSVSTIYMLCNIVYHEIKCILNYDAYCIIGLFVVLLFLQLTQ